MVKIKKEPTYYKKIDNRLALKIQSQRIILLYKQLPLALIGESIAATLLCIVLWRIIDHTLLIGWLLFISVGSTLCRGILIYQFFTRKEALSDETGLQLYSIGIVFTAAAWGFAGYFLMPDEGIFHQTFLVFMLIGLSAAANTVYSPIFSLYAFFLGVMITPFIVWLLLHGGLYVWLGFSSFIYIGLMLSTSYNTGKLINSSLKLRFEYSELSLMQKRLEKKIRQRSHALKESLGITTSILESASDGILVVNLNKEIKYYNHKFLEMWGFTPELIASYSHNDANAINFVINQINKPNEFVERINYLYNHPEQESIDELEFKDGRIFERHSMPQKLDDTIIGRLWNFRDLTEHKRMGQRIAHEATHDALTGLPNRTLLNDRIYQGISCAKRFQSSLTVLYIDLDNFKDINNNFGYAHGDMVIQDITSRLTSCIRENDTLARFGGDEFIVLILTQAPQDILNIVERIYDCMKKPMKIGSHEITVTVSIGISMYPKDGKDPSTLLVNADKAMMKAKKQGRNQYQLYTP